MEEKRLNKTITDFMSNEYYNYSLNVLEERAIPSVIDGFKPGGRKIIHAALTGTTKNGKLVKLLALLGDCMRISLYAHGDASLSNTIVGLCKDYSDNLNPLESDSQVGTLRDNSSGASRYLYVKHSKYMDLIYKTDFNLLDYVFEEGQYVEPMNYLPIIPTVLCKNNIGVAIGYSIHNISYNPIDVIDACIEYLKARKNAKVKISKIIRPYIRGIKQSNFKFIDNSWYNYGEWKTNYSKDLLTITDLPYDVSYEAFEKLLNKLEEDKKIKLWKNKSVDGGVNYEIFFNKNELKTICKTDDKIISLFKLVKQCPADLLWLLDENHKLKYFENIYSVIKYFINYRLGIYSIRKKKLVKIYEELYKNNSDLIKFIELVCKGKLKIRNRSKKDIKVDMTSYKLPIELISVPMSKVTLEEKEELLRQNNELKEKLNYIRNTSEKDMYINDLNELRTKIFKDFK